MTAPVSDRYIVRPSVEEPPLWALVDVETGAEVFKASKKTVNAERAQRIQYEAVEHRDRRKKT